MRVELIRAPRRSRRSRPRRSSELGAVLKYSLRRAVTSHGVFSCIPFPRRNIEKRIAFSGIIYLSPNLSPNRQNSRQVCREGHGCHKSGWGHSMLNLVKLSSQP
ncbi:hypothetical protein AVEN_158732-1 [Araneus ventricosus]|uniref:Uncharacterized protein n=1 Tax=Araneus ventricosus TaxID=182803 RepID=A0A4Y2N9A9_ARAVE|nr:hypothetical protein AVEN_158732-1 [Araneus ventricosus]